MPSTAKEELKKRAGQKNEEPGEDKLLDEAIQDEAAGIKMYGKLIAQCDDPEEMKIYEGILTDEKRHLGLLKKIKNDE